MKPLRYAEQPPPPALAAQVMAGWTFETRLAPGEDFAHHIWPDGCVSLFVAAHAGIPIMVGVTGPGTRAQRVPVHAGIVHRGLRFWPDAGAAMVGIDAAALRDRMLPADALWQGEALDIAMAHARTVAAAGDDDAVAAAWTHWLGARAAAVPVDAAVRTAVHRLVATSGEIAIAAVAREVALGPRQLQRRFLRATGLTPKEYARVRRVRRALGDILAGEDRWAALAHALGYADQSHMVRELGAMTGLTPGALGERLEIIEHEGVVP